MFRKIQAPMFTAWDGVQKVRFIVRINKYIRWKTENSYEIEAMNSVKAMRQEVKKYIDTADEKIEKMVHAIQTNQK